MLTKEEKNTFRSRLFRHLDGLVTLPIGFCLKREGVTKYLLEQKKADLATISKNFNANDGYLNVGLRVLCSQGWLEQEVDNTVGSVVFNTNARSKIAFDHFDMYREPFELLQLSEKYHPRLFELKPFQKLEATYKSYKNKFGINLAKDGVTKEIQEQILAHIEGVLLGPTLVHLGMTGMFHKYFMETRFKPEEFHKDAESFGRLLDILADLEWFTKKKDTYQFTEKGLFFAKRASAYGVTVSYIPTLRKVDELMFGNPKSLKVLQVGEEEKHIDREMNIWGSGGAHASYFKVIDEIVIDLFNKPIDEQPRGILDMGCGNGAFLCHLFSVIENQTKRGKMLDDYPLSIIGVDYNEAALKVSKANLVSNDIWAKVIWGDIGDPDRLALDLKENYNIELTNLLNVRTFLDHNRIWKEPSTSKNLKNSSSTGAYAFEGKWKQNNLVSESLREHFKKWLPYVQKHGLILIELHTVKPELVSQKLGKTPATAYDATHGFSDQYILEVHEFLDVMEKVGLYPDMDKFRKFPNSDLATVTVNLFTTDKS